MFVSHCLLTYSLPRNYNIMKNKFAYFLIMLPSVFSFNPLQGDFSNEAQKEDTVLKTTSDLFLNVKNAEYWAKCIGHNEDATLNFTGLTSKYGYPTETHTAITDDGYILTIYRIVKGKKCTGKKKITPVIMMHGYTDSSDTFIVSGPDSALGYLLADACYDVWLPNHRGNRYSREHVYYSAEKDPEQYWNFTYDEHGMYDLKAVVDYVLDATDSKKVSYIGHSQGTTNFYVLASTLPEYNAYFAISISLAPAAWLHHMKSPIRLLALATPEIKVSLKLLKTTALFRREDPTNKILELLCQYLPAELCGVGIMVAAGGDPTTISCEVIKTILGHYPCASSTNNLIHYGQAVNTNKFRRYDYGSTKENVEVYGSEDPPEYDVTKITAPVALIASRGDLLTVIEDVATLKARLPNVVHYCEMDESCGHGHFVWSKLVATKLATIILDLLKKYGCYL